jgi:hypothetical protein
MAMGGSAGRTEARPTVVRGRSAALPDAIAAAAGIESCKLMFANTPSSDYFSNSTPLFANHHL